MTQSDLVGFSTRSFLRFNQSEIQNGFFASAETPIPDAWFPFRRLGASYNSNGVESYIYHQMNESIIAEEIWDEAEFWQPSRNISIGT